MNDENGQMLRRPQSQDFARQYYVPLITFSDLIRNRSCTEKLVRRMEMNGIKVGTPLGEFARVNNFILVQDDQMYHALLFGDVEEKSGVPVFLVEDGLDASLHAHRAQQYMVQNGHGVLIYVDGLAQLLQINGELMARQSMFGMAMQTMHDLEVASVQLPLMKEATFDPHGFGVAISGCKHLATSL